MGYQDREPRSPDSQTRILAKVMNSLVMNKELLMTERDREKLVGRTTAINHFRDTGSGLGVISEVNFTILDGATFTWDTQLWAAVAYGRIPGQSETFLAGSVFDKKTLRRYDLDPQDIFAFPELISEIPGHFNTFTSGLAFRIAATSPYTWLLTFGGQTPETRREIPFTTLELQATGRKGSHHVHTYLAAAVRGGIPSL